MIYLDNAATTPPTQSVLNAFNEVPFYNSETIYDGGRKVMRYVDKARQSIANILECLPENILFTSSGSESNSLAILGLKNYLCCIGKRHIITSAFEHKSVLKCMEELENDGFWVTYIKPDETGVINSDDVINAVSNNTGFISIMFINNETGAINDVYKLASYCKQKSILFHTDCVQAFGAVPFSASRIGADFISISAHKIHGMKGAGALYAADPSKLAAIIKGGDQEFGLRGGTHNASAIYAFGEAAKEHDKFMRDGNGYGYAEWDCDIFKQQIERFLEGNVLYNIPSKHLPKILSITFPGVDSETLIMLLDSKGVMVSGGSACNLKDVGKSHVLKAIGLSDENIKSTIRVSFSRLTTTEDMLNAGRIIAECVNLLRNDLRV